jgi:hypothetical protein
MSSFETSAVDYPEHWPEVHLVIPLPISEASDEAFDLLEASGIDFDVHDTPWSSEYPFATLQAYDMEFLGPNGVRRFLELRQLGHFDFYIECHKSHKQFLTKEF